VAGIGILGTGSVQPRRVKGTGQIVEGLGLKPGSLHEAGVSYRGVATEETTVSMGVDAAREALRDAGLQASDMDLILSACAVPYQPIPATAPLIQRELGAKGVAAWDVNSTCLSFLTAVDTARAMIIAGRARRVLVVSSEMPSRALPWHDDPMTAALFGDGAAAAVVGGLPEGSKGIVSVSFETHSEAWEACQLASGGTRHDYHGDLGAFEAGTWFRMDGKALYKLTARHFRRFVKAALDQAGWKPRDVDLLIPHQASRGGLDHAARILEFVGIPRNRMVDILSHYGNQVAASLPTALDKARRSGLIEPGSKVLLLGTSAGVSLGALAMEA